MAEPRIVLSGRWGNRELRIVFDFSGEDSGEWVNIGYLTLWAASA